MDIQELNKAIIEDFRANDGKVSGQFEGAPLLLLTTIGAKSRLSRTNPLVYLTDNDRYIIIASYAGAPNNPPWFYNLKSNPDVEVEVGNQRLKARAEILGEPERSDLYQKAASIMPAFSDYQSKTTRTIPVIALHLQ